MLQSVALLYVLAAVICDRWLCPKPSDLVLAVLVAVVFNNSVTANLYYNYMDQSFRKTHAAAVELSTRIHMLDDGTIKHVVIFGGLGLPHLPFCFGVLLAIILTVLASRMNKAEITRASSKL